MQSDDTTSYGCGLREIKKKFVHWCLLTLFILKTKRASSNLFETTASRESCHRLSGFQLLNLIENGVLCTILESGPNKDYFR